MSIINNKVVFQVSGFFDFIIPHKIKCLKIVRVFEAAFNSMATFILLLLQCSEQIFELLFKILFMSFIIFLDVML